MPVAFYKRRAGTTRSRVFIQRRASTVMKNVATLDAVSRACRTARYCKSKINGTGTFSVETPGRDGSDDPRKVWIEENVVPARKFIHLDRLLQRSGFYTALDGACAGKSTCKVVIKPNISIAVQKNLLNYTDPALVDWLASRIEKDGRDVAIVESQNAFTLVRKDHEPVAVAKNIGYTRPVVNLSVEEKIDVPYKGGKITVSPRVRDADFVVNFPKGRSHMQRRMTGALKNMYGAIPDMDKFELYHWKESGVSVEDAIVAVNHSTPPDFTIVDMIDTIDGEDEHVSFTKLDEHVSPRLLMAGKDPMAIDKAIAVKMGYGQNAPPVTAAEVDFRGDFDIREPGLVDGSLGAIMIDGKPWKKPALNAVYSFLLDDLLKAGVKFPYARQGMKMIGNNLEIDVI
jgi:uncharacterized protein (DUF362 family)